MRRFQHLQTVTLFLLLLLWSGGDLFAQVNNLDRIKNKPKGELQTTLTFELQSSPNYEILSNFPARVMVIKFRGTLLGDVARLIAFQDPILKGLQLEEVEVVDPKSGVTNLEYWAKIRTKHTNLGYRVLPDKEQKHLIIEFTRKISKAKKTEGVELVEMLRELDPKHERLILTLDKAAQTDMILDKTQPGSHMKVRIRGAKMTPDLIIPGAPTKILKGITVEERGRYLLITIKPETYAINIEKKIVEKPEYQIILNITPDKDRLVAKEAEITIEETELKELMSQEEMKKEKFLIEKFEEAEYQFRIGEYARAGLLFRNIYNYQPLTEIGVRAVFRSADAFALEEKRKKEQGRMDFVIQQYREAINAALTANLGYEDVPRAYYGIGQAYQKAGLNINALRQYNLIQDLYPGSPFAKDAHFESGVLQMELFRFQKAIDSLENFVKENHRAPQVPAALFKIGQAEFKLKRFSDAKRSFDKAWSLDPDFMKRDPKLMFHMGEAYFENQDYATAREIYETLIDNHPNETFSNLVAIRIGDFFRAENKLGDAIKAYEKAINKYTKELHLVGRMRIANLHAENPEPDAYKKALSIYNYVIDEHPFSQQIQDALLRKGLTLSLFHHHHEAVKELERFCAKYPENIYVKNRIIQERILETIENSIKNAYNQEDYMGVLGIFEKYKHKYFTRPHLSKCFIPSEEKNFNLQRPSLLDRAPLFLLADSSFRLGLNDKALEFYDHIDQQKTNTLSPLALFSKGVIFDLKEDFDQAQAVYQDFITRFPSHTYTPTVKKALGDSYHKVHKFDRVDRAIRIYNQTIRDYQDSDNALDREIIAPSWFALANLYQGIGKYDEAIRSYKQVLSTYEHPLEDEKVLPIVVETHFTLGNLFYELNQMPEAMAAYNEAIRLFPSSDKAPWAKYQKGQIFIKYNEKTKALKIFEELIEQAKKEPDALWGPLAVESHKLLVNDLSFEKYLGREASGSFGE